MSRFILNEKNLIDLVKKINPIKNKKNELGIGDDCAFFPKNSSESILVSTDLLVEHIHFRRSHGAVSWLGEKALAVNISDIAAMGGIPQYALISLALPRNLKNSWVKEFYSGLFKLAKKHQVLLIGGDTSASKKDIFINVTIIGLIKNRFIKTRDTAKDQDLIYGTSNFGHSALGFHVLENLKNEKSLNKYPLNKYRSFINAHLRPKTYLDEAQYLSKFKEVHAMMDSSDGPIVDLKHILNLSKVGAEIDLSRLEKSFDRKYLLACQNLNVDPIKLALAGGEDYGPIFTVELKNEKKRLEFENKYFKKFNKRLVYLGVINKNLKNLNFIQNGLRTDIKFKGFQHF